MKIPLFGRRGELAFEVRSKWDGYTIIVIEAMRYLEKQHWSGKENHFFRLCLADLDQPAPLALNPVGKRMKAVLRGCSRSSAFTQPARRGQCNIHSSTCRPWGLSPYTWGINSPTQWRWVPAPPKKPQWNTPSEDAKESCKKSSLVPAIAQRKQGQVAVRKRVLFWQARPYPLPKALGSLGVSPV